VSYDTSRAHHHLYHHTHPHTRQVNILPQQPSMMNDKLCSYPSDAAANTTVPAPPAGAGRAQPSGMVEAPRLLMNGIELSIHTCTRSMVREVRYIFPHLSLSSTSCADSSGDKARMPAEPHINTAAAAVAAGGSAIPGTESNVASEQKEEEEEKREKLLIIPTIQKSRVDTVRFGVEVEEEKDRCLEYFADFARPLCESLRSEGHWADYIDPCSGLPVMTPHCTRPYSEVAGFEHLLRYKTQNAGCCKILLHPRWGSSCYPATIFTTAPLKKVQAAIKVVEKGEGRREGGIMAPVGMWVD
jgi:hypothetical protein